MLKIDPKYVQGVRNARESADLHRYVQTAIELEHATIPPYLCAYFTLEIGSNQEVGEIIRSVVIEEMLHMTIASNLLIALGGKPQINGPGFIPTYPGHLPMGIGGELVVTLRKCSIEQIRDVFMEIEEPEEPIHFPGLEAAPAFATIGQFYQAIDDKIRELGQEAFRGDFDQEVVDARWFSTEELFRIDGPESAGKAIGIIVEQGEGTPKSPLDPEGELAHYYRFQEIVKGRRLVKDPNVPEGYSFSGPPIVLDDSRVYDMQADPKAADYPAGSRARRMADQFAFSYTKLLNALHGAFNGKPRDIDNAMGLMYELRFLAQQCLETVDPTSGERVGLCFEYAPVNA